MKIDADIGRLAGIAALAVLAASAAACETEPPSRTELQSTIDHHLEASPGARQTRKQFLDDLKNGADRRIRAALAGDLLTGEVANRLVAAKKSGVRVEVVADADDRSSDPAQKLLDNDIPVTFGDGSLNYVPNPNLSTILGGCKEQSDRRRVVCSAETADQNPCGGSQGTDTDTMCRPGNYNRMTHRFVLIDEKVVWNLAGGLDADDGGPLGWRAESELLHEDFGREFRQLSGGVFATTLDAYNGPLKSRTDDNLEYMTDAGVLQVRFNPQERLLKHVIDEVYRARNSVAITTPVLRNPFLLDALEYKNANGFDVRVVVGPDQPKGSARQRLRKIGARQISKGRDLPTVVVVDGVRFRTDDAGRQWPRTGLVLSHPLWYSQPYSVERAEPSDRALVYPSDHFADGTLWLFYEYSSNAGGGEETDQLDRLEAFIADTWSRANSL